MKDEPTAQDRENFFGGIIYAYTRSQAVADGVQVEVTKTAQEAGSRFAKRTAPLGASISWQAWEAHQISNVPDSRRV